MENRAEHLYLAVNNTSYDPASTNLQLSVAGLLNAVKGQYGTARASVINNLTNCLQATSTLVATICAPVLNSSSANISTAYDYVKANGGSQLLLQNTIALQYAGIFTNYNSSTWPQDLVYYNPLPNWQINDFFLIRNQAGLVGFANAPYVDDGTTKQTASIAILPLVPTADLSGILSEVFRVQSTPRRTGSLVGLAGRCRRLRPPTTPSQPLAWLGGPATAIPRPQIPASCGGASRSSTADDFPQSFRITPIDDLFGPAAAAPDTVATAGVILVIRGLFQGRVGR